MGGTIRSISRLRPLGASIAVLVVAGAAIGLAGCGSDDADDPTDTLSADAVLTALVEWTVQSGAPPTTDDSAAPPVVYIAPVSGETIAAGVQAAVVASTDGDATVVFADDKSEAFDDTTDDQSVHNDGVLLLVGALPTEDSATGATTEIAVERYRSIDDSGSYLVTIAASHDGATVTAVTAG